MPRYKQAGFGLALLLGAAIAPAHQSSAAAQESAMGAPIVFFDIAGPADAGLDSFYREVFGWTVGAGGSVSVEARAPLSGTLRVEEVNESLLYFGVADVAATLEAIAAHGGTVEAERFEVPGVVVLGLFRDPAGNRMGLVELDAAGNAIIP